MENKTKNKSFFEYIPEELNGAVPAQFSKIKEVKTPTKNLVARMEESEFYGVKSLSCYDFYKHISRFLKKNDL